MSQRKPSPTLAALVVVGLALLMFGVTHFVELRTLFARLGGV